MNFLKENPEEAKIMGDNGRKAVLEKFNWENEEKKLIELYNTILS
jgi:glycosyltransferase involved in cell wall biosynthesis